MSKKELKCYIPTDSYWNDSLEGIFSICDITCLDEGEIDRLATEYPDGDIYNDFEEASATEVYIYGVYVHKDGRAYYGREAVERAGLSINEVDIDYCDKIKAYAETHNMILPPYDVLRSAYEDRLWGDDDEDDD